MTLGTSWTILNGPLVLNGNSLQYSNTALQCTTTVPTLSFPITHDSSISTPTAKLTGPYILTTACSSAPSAVYDASTSVDPTYLGLTYKWTYSASSTLSTLAAYLATQTSSSISLNPITYFSGFTGTVNIIVNTTNIFSEYSSFTIPLIITSSKLLTVEIDVGKEFSCSNKDKVSFKADVKDYCGVRGSASYVWKYEGGNNTSPSSSLSNLSKTNKLYLDSGVLDPGFYYNFSATVTINGISGSAYIIITITQLPLVADIDGPKKVKATKDLSLDAKRSYDPNNKFNTLLYAWSCTLDTVACSGSLKTLMSGFSKSSITIPSSYLKSLTVINVTVTVSTSTQSASATLGILIDSKYKSTIVHTRPLGKIPYSREYKIDSKVTPEGSDPINFSWLISDDVSVDSPYFPFLYVAPGKFTKQGHTYALTITVTESGDSYDIPYTAVTNVGPVCDYVTINTKSGYAVFTSFEFSTSCVDGDDEDYPLYGYAGFVTSYGGRNTPTSSSGFDTKGKSRYPMGSFQVFYAICDSLNDCLITHFDITTTKSNGRRLDEVSDLYDQESIDIDNVPMLVMTIASTYNLTYEFLGQMFADLKEYESQQEIKTEILMQTVMMCLTELISELQWPSYTNSFVIGVYNYADGLLDTYALEITDETLKIIVGLAENMVEFNTTSNRLLKLAKDFQLHAFQYYFITKDPGFEDLLSLGDQNSISSARQKELGVNIFGVPTIVNDIELLINTLGVEDNTQINIVISRFPGLTAYSDLLEIGFSESGYYSDTYNLVNTNETALTVFTTPVQVSLQAYVYHENYICGYLDENYEYSTSGCKVTDIFHNNTDDTTLVTFEISHTSIFSLLLGNNCDYDFSPFAIIVVVFFIELFIIPYALLLDSSHKKSESENENIDQGLSKTVDHYNSSSSPGSPTERPFTSISYSVPEIEEFSESSIENPENADYTIEFKLNPLESLEKKIGEVPKSVWASMIEGHLLFGLIVYRPIFTRFRRVLTLFTVLMLQLLLEGLLIKGFENYNSGMTKDTQWIFDNYTGDYLGYTVLAIAIAFPVELFLMIAFSRSRAKSPELVYPAFIAVLLITVGSFIGVFILAFKFCFEWSGYWAASFLWSILLEVFFLQFIYMVVRFFLFREGKSPLVS